MSANIAGLYVNVISFKIKLQKPSWSSSLWHIVGQCFHRHLARLPENLSRYLPFKRTVQWEVTCFDFGAILTQWKRNSSQQLDSYKPKWRSENWVLIRLFSSLRKSTIVINQTLWIYNFLLTKIIEYRNNYFIK